MKKKIIKVDTEEEKKIIFDKFNSVNSRNQAHILFGISDNASGVKYLKEIADIVGFDFGIYKRRKAKPKIYCLQCGKEITKKGNKKFCCQSCATTYQNLHTIKTEETKKKISEGLKKYYDSQLKPYEEKIKVSINHREKPKKYCLQCGKEITSDNRSNRKYCSVECFNISQRENVINKWLSGDLKINPNGKLPLTIRNYILEKNNFKCEECGFEGYNRKTGNTILQFHHKDGDSGNNNVDNIQLLCPNCHAMTENYMALNKGYSARNKRYK